MQRPYPSGREILSSRKPSQSAAETFGYFFTNFTTTLEIFFHLISFIAFFLTFFENMSTMFSIVDSKILVFLAPKVAFDSVSVLRSFCLDFRVNVSLNWKFPKYFEIVWRQCREIARPKIIWRLPDNNRKKLHGTITLYSKAFWRQLDYSEIEGGCPLQNCPFRSNLRAKGEYQNTA